MWALLQLSSKLRLALVAAAVGAAMANGSQWQSTVTLAPLADSGHSALPQRISTLIPPPLDGAPAQRTVRLVLSDNPSAEQLHKTLSLVLPVQMIRRMGIAVGVPPSDPSGITLEIVDERAAAAPFRVEVRGETLRGTSHVQRHIALRVRRMTGDSDGVMVTHAQDGTLLIAAPAALRRSVSLEVDVSAGALYGEQAQAGIYTAELSAHVYFE